MMRIVSQWLRFGSEVHSYLRVSSEPCLQDLRFRDSSPTQAAWQSLQRDLWRWQCPARLLNPPIPWKNSRRMYGCSFLARVTGLVDGPIEVE